MSSLPKHKCPHCGAALDAQAKFCGECGAKIISGNPPPESLVERPQPPTPAPVWQDPPRKTRPPAAVQNVQVHSPSPAAQPPSPQVNVYVNQHGAPPAYYGPQGESAAF